MTTVRSGHLSAGGDLGGPVIRALKTLQATAIVVALACAGSLGTPGHVVRRGETLASIAGKYGVSVAALAQANGIKNPNVVYAGRTLVVPGKASTSTAPAAAAGTPFHVVRPGDSVASIARKYRVSVDVLRAANGIVNDKIYNGGRILLAPRNTTPLPKATGGTHVVRAGETLASIAKRYGTTSSALVTSNRIKNPNLITIGKSLQVPSGGGASFSCPVTGATFMNDWGFPRAGGRFHEGNDLFAPRGTPVHAPANGVVTQTNGSLGGHQVMLTADDGTVFYGMHLDRFAKAGRVAAGDVIGYVGDTGDALGGRPHLHFEVHPGGGFAVNPYPLIMGRC